MHGTLFLDTNPDRGVADWVFSGRDVRPVVDPKMVRLIRENARKRRENLDIETRRKGWERWHAKQRRSVTREGIPVGRKLAQSMMDFKKS
jgi:hypothetical protein